MVNTICKLVILFFIFAVLGWCVEVVLKFIQYRRFINRGFLIGPYCPIYGWGVVAVTVFVGGLFTREGTVSEIFWAGYVLCGALEYFTSWYMEKRFHARWWDYSTKPMNLHGRIWVGNLLLFGVASVIIVLWVDPVFFSLMEKLSPFWLHLAASAILALFAADHIASAILMDVVRKEIDAQEGDNTEEISQRVHELLRNRNLLFRRIEKAYPDLHSQPYWLTLQVRQAKREYREASRMAAQMMKKRRRSEASAQELETALETEKCALRALRELQKKQIPHTEEF